MNRHFLVLLFAVLFSPFARAGDPDWAEAKLAREATKTLRTVQRFTVAGVGESGYPAPAEFSFRALLKRPDAVAECQKLITEASPAGQLYGLLGLRLLDPKAFQTALPRYKGSKASIPTMSGCIVHQTTAGAVAKGIERGTIKKQQPQRLTV